MTNIEKNSIEESVEQKSYELAFLVENEELVREVLKLVNQHSIEIVSEGQLKKVSLAYEISGVEYAYFGFFHVRSLPSVIKLLEGDLRTNPSVIRFLITSLPKEKVTEGRAPVRTTRKPTVSKNIVQKAGTKMSQPLSNEALEKKIEEILR